MKRLLTIGFSIFLFLFMGCAAITANLPTPFDSEQVWIQQGGLKNYLAADPDGKRFVWQTAVFFKNIDGKTVRGVHTIFDETILVTYANREKGIVTIWVQLENRGMWHTGASIDFEPILDISGRMIAVTVILLDHNGEEIMAREVRRKKW